MNDELTKEDVEKFEKAASDFKAVFDEIKLVSAMLDEIKGGTPLKNLASEPCCPFCINYMDAPTCIRCERSHVYFKQKKQDDQFRFNPSWDKGIAKK